MTAFRVMFSRIRTHLVDHARSTGTVARAAATGAVAASICGKNHR
jgi:hypothetical protein